MRYFVNIISLIGILCVSTGFSWGFFGHQRINRLAVFILPEDMISFYKANIGYITEASVNPDKRRYSVVDEAARHYIDLDHYGDSVLHIMPHRWNNAVEKFSEDTLKAYGIVPWHINRMYLQLKDAFFLRDPQKILRVSAELGHYIGDAHVPLHTTENYNGQLTGQEGIHGFWESRLPELFSDEYDFIVGKAAHIDNVQEVAWHAVTSSHVELQKVLGYEKQLSLQWGDRKYSFETKGNQTIRVFSEGYSKAYHKILDGMVERRMRAAIKMTGDVWYTAWVDAGQPELKSLLEFKPTDEELRKRQEELRLWKEKRIVVRPEGESTTP